MSALSYPGYVRPTDRQGPLEEDERRCRRGHVYHLEENWRSRHHRCPVCKRDSDARYFSTPRGWLTRLRYAAGCATTAQGRLCNEHLIRFLEPLVGLEGDELHAALERGAEEALASIDSVVQALMNEMLGQPA